MSKIKHIQVSSLIIVSVVIASWLIKHFGITNYSTDSHNHNLGGGMIQCHKGKGSCETLPGRFSGGWTKESSLVQIRIFLFF